MMTMLEPWTNATNLNIAWAEEGDSPQAFIFAMNALLELAYLQFAVTDAISLCQNLSADTPEFYPALFVDTDSLQLLRHVTEPQHFTETSCSN